MNRYVSIAIIFLISFGGCTMQAEQSIQFPQDLINQQMMAQRDYFRQFIDGNELNLTGLNLGQIIPGVFQCPAFAHITRVVISENPLLTNIDNETFIGLDNVQELYLTVNGIDTIAPRAFRGLNNLRILNLSTNNLTNIVPEVFQGLNLQNLDITNNRINRRTRNMLLQLNGVEVNY